MPETIAIALSGGIDSLVGAFLLKQAGYRIIGIHFVTGYEPEGRRGNTMAEKMRRLGDRLQIPLEIIDIRQEFKTRVIDYFIRTYQAGKTPNPCVVCNPEIKFGTVFKAAKQLGADRLATGHYARTAKDEAGRIRLKKGVDPDKDQSYFLSRLTRDQLASARFPLGGFRKSDTFALARRENLKPLVASESQDVCFIRDKAYGDFLAREAGSSGSPGPIVDTQGRPIGEHPGLYRFTIGQRRGINCPAAEPYYVIRIIPGENKLVVGCKDRLLRTGCSVSHINWTAEKPGSPCHVSTRVRYRHKAARSVLTPVDDGNRAHVRFLDPQSAITPGQAAVFYRDDDVLGGGWIEG